MPNIDAIDGIKINIYNGDHVPPHIHAIYNKYEVLIEIITRDVYAGYLPNKQLKKAKMWLMENKEEALDIFNELNSNLR